MLTPLLFPWQLVDAILQVLGQTRRSQLAITAPLPTQIVRELSSASLSNHGRPPSGTTSPLPIAREGWGASQNDRSQSSPISRAYLKSVGNLDDDGTTPAEPVKKGVRRATSLDDMDDPSLGRERPGASVGDLEAQDEAVNGSAIELELESGEGYRLNAITIESSRAESGGSDGTPLVSVPRTLRQPPNASDEAMGPGVTGERVVVNPQPLNPGSCTITPHSMLTASLVTPRPGSSATPRWT